MISLIQSRSVGELLKPALKHTIITNNLTPPNPPGTHPHTRDTPPLPIHKGLPARIYFHYALPHGLRGIPAQLYAYHDIRASFST